MHCQFHLCGSVVIVCIVSSIYFCFFTSKHISVGQLLLCTLSVRSMSFLARLARPTTYIWVSYHCIVCSLARPNASVLSVFTVCNRMFIDTPKECSVVEEFIDTPKECSVVVLLLCTYIYCSNGTPEHVFVGELLLHNVLSVLFARPYVSFWASYWMHCLCSWHAKHIFAGS